jgi:hypothetical protein
MFGDDWAEVETEKRFRIAVYHVGLREVLHSDLDFIKLGCNVVHNQ